MSFSSVDFLSLPFRLCLVILPSFCGLLIRSNVGYCLQGVKKPSRRVGAPLEIATSPGYDLLSEKERSVCLMNGYARHDKATAHCILQLCSVIRLYPRQYTVIKETLLRENLRAKGLQRRTALQLIKVSNHDSPLIRVISSPFVHRLIHLRRAKYTTSL